MDEGESVQLNIRPPKKFCPEEFEATMREVVHSHLDGKVYDHMYAPDWTQLITREIHDKLKELALERYKFAVQVVIGEDRGQGLKIISGCIWDKEADGQAMALFTGKTMYCVAVAFAVYSYLYE